jgi:uncharacterized protein YjbJ (UPF0337 family)
MDTNVIEGKWEELKGKVKKKWGKLTEDDLMVVKGNQQELVGKLQARYGYTKEVAEKHVTTFLDKVGNL